MLLVQFLVMIVTLINNVFTDQALNSTLLSDLVPMTTEIVPFLAKQSLVNLITMWGGMMTSINVLLQMWHVLSKLGPDRFIDEGLKSMLPFLQWILSVKLVFDTEWAWAHPCLGVLLLGPSFCLINSKMIVCNFTKMETGLWESSLFWILLFPLNTWLGGPQPEWMLACVIGAAHLATYSIFVKCTIDQICGFLKINCLSIGYLNKDKKKQ